MKMFKEKWMKRFMQKINEKLELDLNEAIWNERLDHNKIGLRIKLIKRKR